MKQGAPQAQTVESMKAIIRKVAAAYVDKLLVEYAGEKVAGQVKSKYADKFTALIEKTSQELAEFNHKEGFSVLEAEAQSLLEGGLFYNDATDLIEKCSAEFAEI